MVSILGVIFAIRYASATATWLTYLALVGVPILAAAALGWLMRGARPWLTVLVVALFMVAWRAPHTLSGQAAGALLSGFSCVTLGVLLGTITPARWVKLGIVAMAGADTWLILSNQLQAPNNLLVAAKPSGGLPRLQSEQFGTVTMGYGDLFVASLLGAVYASRARVQRLAAALTLSVAAAFDLLFLVAHNLPATVPVALALLIVETISACCGQSRRVDVTPPRVT